MKFKREQIELYHLFKNEYIKNGYLYSGSFPKDSILIRDIFKGTNKEKLISNMLENKILQVRECKEPAYELTYNIRKILIDKYNLKEKWLEHTPQCVRETENEILTVEKNVNNNENINLGNLEDRVTIPTWVIFYDIYIDYDKSKTIDRNVEEFLNKLNSETNEIFDAYYFEEDDDDDNKIRVELCCRTYNVDIPIYHKKEMLRSIVEIKIDKLLDEISNESGIEIKAKEDPKYKLVQDAMSYQVGKAIGEMAAVLKGKVDGILLTGGIAHNPFLVDYVKEMVGFIAPIKVYAGEDEMRALAMNGLMVLRGELSGKIYK